MATQPTPEPPAKTNGAPRAGTTTCPANIQETKIAFGFVQQPDIPTPNTAPQLWSLTKTNPALSVLSPVNETDAADIGKGNEFPGQVFASNMDATATVEKYVSSEFLAWLFCFTTGQATKAPAGTGWSYTAVPANPVTACINLPPFTLVEQIRPQPDSVVDRATIACVVGEWTLTMASGPGRANCRVSSTWPASGRYSSPSGLTIPAVTQEHFLNAAGAAININGIDYVLAASFISLEFRWNNNVRLDTGFYPGSGTQNGYAVRGRMEFGVREMTLSFVARAAKGSVELNNLLNQTEAATVFGVTGPNIDASNKHGFTITMPRTRLSAVVNGEDANIVTVNCQVMALNPTDGVTPIISMQATTTQNGILGL